MDTRIRKDGKPYKKRPPLSKEHKDAISRKNSISQSGVRNSQYGKERTIETKIKISQKLKRSDSSQLKWEKPKITFVEKVHKKRVQSLQAREKISNSYKELWKNISNEERDKRLSKFENLKFQDTRPEKIFESILIRKIFNLKSKNG